MDFYNKMIFSQLSGEKEGIYKKTKIIKENNKKRTKRKVSHDFCIFDLRKFQLTSSRYLVDQIVSQFMMKVRPADRVIG